MVVDGRHAPSDRRRRTEEELLVYEMCAGFYLVSGERQQNNDVTEIMAGIQYRASF